MGFLEMIVRLKRVERWEMEESAEAVRLRRWMRREVMVKVGR